MQISKQTETFLAVLVVALVPYALFGKHKKIARWLAISNGMQISLAIIFFQPLFLLPNPFLALIAMSRMVKKYLGLSSSSYK